MIIEFALAVVSIIAGGIATISGFGIGSLITPLLALKVGTGIAVAAVSIAHFFWYISPFHFLEKVCEQTSTA